MFVCVCAYVPDNGKSVQAQQYDFVWMVYGSQSRDGVKEY